MKSTALIALGTVLATAMPIHLTSAQTNSYPAAATSGGTGSSRTLNSQGTMTAPSSSFRTAPRGPQEVRPDAAPQTSRNTYQGQDPYLQNQNINQQYQDRYRQDLQLQQQNMDQQRYMPDGRAWD